MRTHAEVNEEEAEFQSAAFSPEGLDLLTPRTWPPLLPVLLRHTAFSIRQLSKTMPVDAGPHSLEGKLHTNLAMWLALM